MKVGPGVSRSVLRGREAEWIFFGILRSETDDEENDRRSKRVECGKRSKQTIRHRGCRALDAVCPHPTPPGACRWLQPLFSSGGPDLIASWFVIARCKQTSKKKTPCSVRIATPPRFSSPSRDSQTVPAPFPHAHSPPLLSSASIPGLRYCSPLRRAPLPCWPLLCSHACFHIQAPAPRPPPQW